MIDIGDMCPDWSLPTADGGEASLADYRGRLLVLYFYPRADTPGCTTQAQDFTNLLPRFHAAGAAVVGVSKDPVAKLEKFAAKRELEITLVSDAEGDLCEQMGTWVEKNMYGKTFMGIQRSTFVVGPEGKVLHADRKVRAKGHAESLLDALEAGEFEAGNIG